MIYSASLSDCINSFAPGPLKPEEFGQFYYEKTMEIRTNDPYASPVQDIIDSCLRQSDGSAHLFLGHKGCGKSTELNNIKKQLEASGCLVATVSCGLEIDLLNAAYWDLLILSAKSLLNMADKIDCQLDGKILENIGNFWADKELETTEIYKEAASIKTGAGVGTPKILEGLISLYAKIIAELKTETDKRKIIRTKIEARSSEWLGYIGYVADVLAARLDGRRPVIIFEDLDKTDPQKAWDIFYNYAASLSQMPFTVIYSFPIGLSYDVRFPMLDSYYRHHILPMIKIRNKDGQPNKKGIATIKEIIKKRSDTSLYQAKVLDRLIDMTGGSLRDLFDCITKAAARALRRGDTKINMGDAERVLTELKSDLTRRIEQRDYAFLSDILYGQNERIEDKQQLIRMMQASVVLEYNGERWYGLHPLVADFIREQGITNAAKVTAET